MDGMNAAILEEFGQPLVLAERPKPVPGPGEVLIRVEACGACHSDVHLADGDWAAMKRAAKLPLILGHEVAGVIESNNTRVGIPWLGWSCGVCEYCRSGRESLCQKQKITGVMTDGGYAQYMTAPISHAIRIPDGLSAAEAAPLFCAGVTAYKAIKSSGLARGQRVAIFGVGGLGHLAIQIAKQLGAVVCAIDVSAEKLAMAKECGADEVMDASSDLPDKALRTWGPEIAVVTAASGTAYRSAVNGVKRGGTIMVVGMPAQDLQLPVIPIVGGELRILGSAVGTRQDVRDLLALAAKTGIRCHVETQPLDHVNEVFGRLRRGDVRGRIVLVP
jgi:propanol-preferring alcohol dehydrogenase